MCRFLIFKGKEDIRLSHLLTNPAHSIINQSYDSRLRLDMRRPINGDGFGLGYYNGEDTSPCIFRAITPAWNNQNLQTLAEKTKSKLIFAHVRASTYGSLSETNCHPFTYYNYMFMHNGGITNLKKIKRKLINLIDDEYFFMIQGSTDSELAFALFLDTLNKMGYNPKYKIESKDAAKIIREALLKTIEIINKVSETEIDKNDPDYSNEPSLLNFAVTDSSNVVITRYINSKTQEAASLNFLCGSNFIEYSPGQYKMERLDRKQDVIMVASEPLTFERKDWITVPTNTVLTIKEQTVLMHPILDEYYTSDHMKLRSSDFASSKGLMGAVPISQSLSGIPPLEREGRASIVH